MNVPLVLKSLQNIERILGGVSDPVPLQHFITVLKCYPTVEFSRKQLWELKQMQANAEARLARLEHFSRVGKIEETSAPQ
jgi:hypothetical protein